MGIEPTWPAWKAGVLPLNYARFREWSVQCMYVSALVKPDVNKSARNAIDNPLDKIAIVKNIIGNHHSPSRYDYPELAVLKEADSIVNRDEDI